MTAPHLSVTVARHAVPIGVDGLSPLQRLIGDDRTPVRILSAPTGAGKSYAFIQAARRDERVLFMVPTRRLAQNLADDAATKLGADAVDLWSSDETARRRAANPDYRPGPSRAAEADDFEGKRFIVATPESVALMLLFHTAKGAGADPFGPASIIQYFRHVVFDEFHSIDARGFGLCAFFARLCVFAAEANPGQTALPRATFLSATPIKIAPVLAALGVPSAAVLACVEKVDEAPPPGRVPGLRVLHGDVRIDFVLEPDMVALLEAHADEICACLERNRQLVVILDQHAELHAERARFAALFDRLGIPLTRRLAVNSTDDSATSGGDGLFTADRNADPKAFDVLLATSSVEVGVTLRAGMLAMDPGHDALSFVQRVGRVAREDESGLVLVRQDPARAGRRDWLRLLLPGLATTERLIPVSRFNALVLASVHQRFEEDPAVLADDTPPTFFRSMPHRAVWASCLFWHAMDQNQWKGAAGQRHAFGPMRPGKVSYLAKLLHLVAGGDDKHPAHGGAKWCDRFLAEAKILRDIAPSVTLRSPDGTSPGRIPLHYLDRFPALAAFPLLADKAGGWTLWLDRPLHTVLASADSVLARRKRTVLLPNGQEKVVDAEQAAQEAASAMGRLLLHPGTTMAEAGRLRAAIKLVQLTGLVPGEDVAPAGNGVI